MPIPYAAQQTRWRRSDPHVIAAIRACNNRRIKSADWLVGWDDNHGQHLFTWDDTEAAQQHRLAEARTFLRAFKIGGVRVYTHVRQDAAADIPEEGAYVNREEVLEHPSLLAQVLAEITRRMTNAAAELQGWNATVEQRTEVLNAVRTALGLD